MEQTRAKYLSDVSDAEWEFLTPYLALVLEDAPQRVYTMRELFDVVKAGCQCRMLPHDFPPWAAVYQQARRLAAAGVF